MARSVAQKLIESHLVEDDLDADSQPPGLVIRIDQTLTQDATGTMVMLELEGMDIDRVRVGLAAQYIDHNILQQDARNPDDHLYLYSACRRRGIWFSRPGNGVSHPLHQERFGRPGCTLLGSDSHTCAAGAIGMLAFGAGGLDVALAMAGHPFHLMMPKIWGVKLTGTLPEWVSAKDVILEMLRRHGVEAADGTIIEYYGPGLESLSTMDRHVIANMGAELGALTSVFPSDEEVRRFLAAQQREDEWQELRADEGATYDQYEKIDLSSLEPLIAMPSSPDNVRPVQEVAGEPIYQAYIGSSANPGYRDFAIAAMIVDGKRAHPRVSFDVNPTSRQILQNLVRDGHMEKFIRAGARQHQAGCNGCIGMGQAPATKQISLRTVPRNFPGRSGTKEDKICLVSPETAAASALTGKITDPRTLGMSYPQVSEPQRPIVDTGMFIPPLSPEDAVQVQIEKGPGVGDFPELDSFPEELSVRVALNVGDNVSTDEIMPAGARVLPYRSDPVAISRFCFADIDESYHDRARQWREEGGHAIIGGRNYGQGSSREHAALAPRTLGLRLVVAKSIARIHRQNLINFGVLPLTFADGDDAQTIEQGDRLRIPNARRQLEDGNGSIRIELNDGERSIEARHELGSRQVAQLLVGGVINWMRDRKKPNT